MGTVARTNGLLATLLGKTRAAVLALFFRRVDEPLYLRQVARAVGAGLGAVQRELGQLTQAGILRREVRGRQVYFQAQRGCPVFAELHALVVKTAGIADVLREALALLEPRLDVAFVHGSLARGTELARSDVDLLVVGQVTFAEVAAAVLPAQERLGREVNPVVYPAAEFRRKLAKRHHFLTTVVREPKVFLFGGEHELARLGEERLADAAPDESSRNRRSARRRTPRPG